MEEMIEKFEITDIHKSGAVLDPVKLDWMNGEYVKRMEIGELHTRLSAYLEQYESEFYGNIFSQQDYNHNAAIIRELQMRMRRFDEFIELSRCMYGEALIRKDLLVNPKMKIESENEAIDALEMILPHLEIADYSSLDALKPSLLTAIANAGKKNGQVLWPLRVALSGEEFSPGAFELAYILGKEKTIQRVQAVIAAR